MEVLQKFFKNRQAVKVVSTLALLALGANYILVGILEFDVIGDVLSFDDYTLFRLWAVVIGFGLLVVGYASYMQNKALVNESLSKAKAKVAEEASELADKIGDDEKPAGAVVEGEVVKKKVPAKAA